jgi:hypothetical protein
MAPSSFSRALVFAGIFLCVHGKTEVFILLQGAIANK